MKAGANIGSVIGQFAFGFAADYYGRKAVCASILGPILIIHETNTELQMGRSLCLSSSPPFSV